MATPHQRRDGDIDIDVDVDSGRRRRPLAVLLAVLIAGAGAASPAADDVVTAARPAGWYSPPGFDGPLVDYDLAAECAENTRRRDARQAHSYACFLLREFVAAHHPGATFTWQRPAHRAFGFVGTAPPDGATRREVFVRWQSLSDGLQWGFTETELSRHQGPDPFAVVVDPAARARIRDAVATDPPGPPDDVAVERTRDVVTDQRTENLEFGPARESACVVVTRGGLVRRFTLAGDPLDGPPGGDGP